MSAKLKVKLEAVKELLEWAKRADKDSIKKRKLSKKAMEEVDEEADSAEEGPSKDN